jgi:hypothetical protein
MSSFRRPSNVCYLQLTISSFVSQKACGPYSRINMTVVNGSIPECKLDIQQLLDYLYSVIRK